MHKQDSLPYISVRPSGITMFNRSDHARSRSTAQREAEKHLSANDNKGLISRKAKRNISQGIDWMLYLANEKTFKSYSGNRQYKFRLNMVTITLSSQQVHSDQEIKEKLLNQFLIESKSQWGVEKYLWRAESQPCGNIHFHLIFDKFIPWSELRNKWNRIQDKLGYVQRSKHYKKGWTPNSTDVHSIIKVRKLGAYLAKYCTKEATGRKIEGKQWGLSYSLSKMKSGVELRCSEVIEELGRLWKEKRKSFRAYEWHSVYWVSPSELLELGCSRLIEILEEYCGSKMVAIE